VTATPKSLTFHFVDVFAVAPLTGNPVVVVEDADEVPIGLLQQIAREFNQSETTFVLTPTCAGADWRLRSFTPAGVEVFGTGGHNTLGAWWWLADSGKLALNQRHTVFYQQVGDRVLPVTIGHADGRPSHVEMEQDPPVVGAICGDLTTLAASLGVELSDLGTDRVPCQVVSTGVAHLLVPIRDRESVDRIRPDVSGLFAVLKSVNGEGCYAFSLDPRRPGAVAYTRFFNPTVGISEDPATGTAAGPLAAHLVAHGLAERGRIRIEQGTAIGRTSVIDVDVSVDAVKVSARAVVVATGRLTL
jgi:PhzF family phenazine biosynthesis protein